MSDKDQEPLFVSGPISRVSAEPRTAVKGNYLFRGLEIDDHDNRVFLMFPVFSGEDVFGFPLLCRVGGRIAAYDLQFNNRLPDGSIIYTVTPESSLILEPFRPVNVTEAVTAAICVRLADLEYRFPSDEPFWTGKGRIIHQFFDYLMEHPSSEGSFEDSLQIGLPAFMIHLTGSKFRPEFNELKRELGTHFNNIHSWLRENERSDKPMPEVERISSRWGLKGRADAVFPGDSSPEVIELKSGRIPVEEHLLQLFGYTLIFGEKSPEAPKGRILYSATGEIVDLDPDPQKQKRLLLGRNRVIALKQAYSQGIFDLEAIFGKQTECPKRGKCFASKKCRSRSPVNNMSGHTKAYYDNWFRLLSADLRALEEDFATVLDPSTLGQRVAEGLTLQVKSAEPVISPANAESDSNPNSHNASLSPQNSDSSRKTVIELVLENSFQDLGTGEESLLHAGDPSDDNVIRGEIIRSDGEKLLLQTKMPAEAFLPDSPHRKLPAGKLYLERLPFTKARESGARTLSAWTAKSDNPSVEMVIRSFSDPQAHVFAESAFEEASEKAAVVAPNISLDGFNDDQVGAIKQALNAPVYHLIHGPPGTGKTKVLAGLIRACMCAGERLLVVCPTNVALDQLLCDCMDLGLDDFLRVGKRAQAEFVGRASKLNNTIWLNDLARKTAFHRFKEKVLSKKLIAATAYQCAVNPFFLRQEFDRVIIDEAGQLDEPAALAPISKARRFVLGGDHLQLSPIVRAAVNDGGAGLEKSLFERLYSISADNRISRLKIQYRMNKEIQSIPSRLFYENSLTAAPSAASRRLNINPDSVADGLMRKIVNPENPVVFVDVQGPNRGKARPEEASVVCGIVKTLISAGVDFRDIGIITPYRSQQSLIRGMLSDIGCAPVSVNTVDRFQGGEREIIILSLSRSDEVTSFLADQKRLNVSLSRARSKLILVGHGAVLEEHQLFSSVLDGLQRISVES